MNWKQRLRGANEHRDIDGSDLVLGDDVLSGIPSDRYQTRSEISETAHGENQPQEN